MMQRIINLGWTLERFGKFDRYVTRSGRGGREANKAERIGKKYQWIAFHELLARLSDNFRPGKDEWPMHSGQFRGPMGPSVSSRHRSIQSPREDTARRMAGPRMHMVVSDKIRLVG